MSKGSCSGGACQSAHAGAADAQARAINEQDDLINRSLARIKHKLLVMSGKGGVGKSSVAVNLATSLAQRGFKVGLMDVDLHGPSVAQMTGVQGLLDTNDQHVVPHVIADGLKVVSMQSLMRETDQAVIWRGPAKTGVIRQFISHVQWGGLDYLVIDSPPGTGDEPMSVAQTVADAKAVIVTTPQDVALADVRKSINFCRTVNLTILGLIENMGPFNCPCCGETVALFKSGGGRATAEKMGVTLLATLPFDPQVVKACDAGKPVTGPRKENTFAGALAKSVDAIVGRLPA